MTWKLVGKEYHCAPYRITPSVRGWDVWHDTTDLKRIGIGIEMLEDAKHLAQKHADDRAQA